LNDVCDAWSKRHVKPEAGLHLDEHDLDQFVDAAGSFRGLANRLRAM
jgi:hypothetical protein